MHDSVKQETFFQLKDVIFCHKTNQECESK